MFKEKKPPQTGNKLKHGIEKSNKIFEKKSQDNQDAKPEEKKTLKEKAFGMVH
jgi:hypothetical protein